MKKTPIVFLAATLFLGACSANAGEELDGVLQDTFAAEQEYRDTQNELEELEQQEQEIFESVMAMTQEEQEQVAEQSAEAQAIADERLELLKTEKDSLQAAEESFADIDGVIEEADEKLQGDLEAIKAKMNERFAAHDDFAAQYEKLTGLQKELYGMLADEETDITTLQAKTAEVNEQNEATKNAVSVFNSLTEEFNEMKNSFIDKVKESEE